MTYSAAFLLVINRVLSNEGGYVNDPLDPGGETIWGISRRSFPSFNGGDFKNATRDQAIELYFTAFWQVIGGDTLPEPMAFQLMDFAVNAAIPTAIRKFQVALGVADDGHFGPASQAAAAAMGETDQIMRFTAEKIDYYRRCTGWAHDGGGWMARVANDLRFAAVDA